MHQGRVTEVVPLKKIAYNWKFDDYQGDSFVTFELSGQDDTTKLTLTVIVAEDFPEFKRESCIGSWDYFIKQRLKEYLE